MASVCPYCSEEAVEIDEEKQVKVCASCGTVNEEGDFQNEDWIPNVEEGGQNNWRQKRHYGTTDRRKSLARKVLEEQTKLLNIPQEITSQIQDFLTETVFKTNIPKLPKNRQAVVAGCVFIVCRNNNMTMSMRNVAQVTQTDIYVLGRAIRYIQQAVNIELKPLQPEAFVPIIMSQFGVENAPCEKLAVELMKLCDERGLYNGRMPTQIAIVFVYMCIECKISRPSNKNLQQVCKLNSIGAKSIRTHICRVRSDLMHMAKQIPWLTPSVHGIAKCLPDIVKYQQHIESVPLPEWQERKERIQKVRRLKIEQAKQRIANAVNVNCETHVMQPNQDLEEIPGAVSLHGAPKEILKSLPTSGNSNQTSYAEQESTNIREEASRLEKEDMIIESLLQKGYSEAELLDGNLELFLHREECLGMDGERSDLDEKDIPESELHCYIKSPSEIEMVSVEPACKKKKL